MCLLARIMHEAKGRGPQPEHCTNLTWHRAAALINHLNKDLPNPLLRKLESFFFQRVEVLTQRSPLYVFHHNIELNQLKIKDK